MDNYQLSQTLYLLKKLPQHRCKSEIDSLVQFTQELPFFNQYYKQENGYIIHRECCKYMFIEHFNNNEIVFNIGSVGTKFYVILQGEVQVLIKKNNHQDLECVRILKTGDSFGELALINRKPRLATIKCINDCIFAVLEKKQFQDILHYEQTKKIEINVDYFSKISIFSLLNRAQLTQIYLNSFLYEYDKGQYVIQEGDESNYFYIIKSGVFQVKKQQITTIEPLILFELGEQQVFGFFHLFNKTVYEYTLQCLTSKGSVYQIQRTSLIEKIFEPYAEELNIYNKELKQYESFKQNQEQITKQKYHNYFNIKQYDNQQNELNILTKFNQEKKVNNIKYDKIKRNCLMKQKIDNLVELSQKRFSKIIQTPLKNQSLIDIFLKSHKGIKDKQSPSRYNTNKQQKTSLYDDFNISPFLTFRSNTPANTRILFHSHHQTKKESINKFSLFQQSKENNKSQEIRSNKNSVILSPNIMKIKVNKI